MTSDLGNVRLHGPRSCLGVRLTAASRPGTADARDPSFSAARNLIRPVGRPPRSRSGRCAPR
jgi:hypothetical protein